ncbi:unnamed protein product [Brassica oleracea var. botrytis]|uniref:CSC1/OSCA1-like 7TM region domain-containing protein n=1 Tax=Brassica oleracea TaxID=3712 RepID=A0A3P6F3L4_BRAOL|nr:unnamed protein product [Brassica oleracea]
MVFVAFVALIILYVVIPVVLVQGLAQKVVITGYLPSLIYQLFLMIVQYHPLCSYFPQSACIKLLVSTIWNSFFANVLSGSALYRVNMFLEPKNIRCCCASSGNKNRIRHASFFISYVVTSGWTEFEVPPTPFSQLFSSLDLSLLNVYAAKYETGGKFWPQLHYLLFGSDAIGIFGLKELPLASSLTIPLPILTVLFSIYCQRRFSANFKSYPTECLVNKDEADAIEQNMSEFYPAVSASRCSGHLT